MLKHRIHSTLINFGRPCPVTDLFGVEGRKLLARREVPEPWRGNITASVMLIDDLARQIGELNRRLRAGHADHPYIPLLLSAPGIGWVLAFTIAAEIGQIERLPSPEQLTGYTVACGAFLLTEFGFRHEVSYGRSLLFALESCISLLRAPSAPLTRGGEIVTIALRLLGPLLFGSALLALRGRVKR